MTNRANPSFSQVSRSNNHGRIVRLMGVDYGGLVDARCRLTAHDRSLTVENAAGQPARYLGKIRDLEEGSVRP